MNAFRTEGFDNGIAVHGPSQPPARTAQQRPVAVVIGSGFGGLAAAIRLSVKGYQVQVVEKLDAPGGRAYVHRQDGFTFDAGPTIITAPFLLEELWALCGKKFSDDVQLVAMDPFYRVRFHDGTWFDYNGDAAHMRAEVARFDPEDLPGYERFLKDAERCKTLGFEGMGDMAFDKITDLLAAIPDFMRMGAWRSLYSLVAKHFRNEKLRIVMSFHPLLIGGNPFAVTCAYALINSLERTWGVHSAMGGTGAIVRGLVNLLAGRGVHIRCNAPVTRICVENGRASGVMLDSGEFLAADIVVSNADTAWTYKHLVAPEHRQVWTDRKIDNGKYSMGLFVWYFGTSRRFHDVPHHMMVLGPRYQGLLQDIFKRHHLAQDFSLYLHRPTATDPALAPAGCDTFYVLSPVPHLDSGTDWVRQAEPYRAAIAQALHETVLPGLKDCIVSSKVTTPQDFQDRLWSYKGAGFGLEPLLLQSAWFRPHNRSEDVPGLFVVGASTHPGAGVPGVLMSAKALETVVPHVPV
ncbi:MAG: phytoene desaturase [Betaproteobacteria bacterium]|nr:phytoene desaturase [Betaproteobacteria bacterium]